MGGPSREALVRAAVQENELWHHIRQIAANDPALMDILTQAKTYYYLKYGGTQYDSQAYRNIKSGTF